VEQHGGTMWCEPRENGNAFIFTIPNAISETVDREHAVKENDYA
jgi:signal transduction histidine kinase